MTTQKDFKIRVKPAVIESLKIKKIHPRQSYNEVIQKILQEDQQKVE